MKRHLIYAFAGVLLAACGKEELPEPDSNRSDGRGGEIRFEIAIAPQQNAGTPQAGSQTRVVTDDEFKCAWEEGDEIGLFASLSDTLYIRNAKLTYTDGVWIAPDPLYWPAGSDAEMIFSAYYPYDARFDPDGYVFGAAADQNASTDGKSGFNRSDLMISAPKTLAGGETVKLFFEHRYALIHLTLDNSKGSIDPNEEVRVILRDAPSKVTIRVSGIDASLSLTPDKTSSDITMQRVEQPGDSDYRTKFTFRALVYPTFNPSKGQSIFRIANGDLLLDGSKLTQTIWMNASDALLFTQRLPFYHHTVPISAGMFRMGSPDTDPYARPNEKPRHWVKLTRGFRMGKYEVTRTQYAEFLNAAGIPKAEVGQEVRAEVDGYGEQKLFTVSQWGWTPKWNDAAGKWEASGDYPMVYVFWHGAKAYADWAGGRLPTEAEWEYTCRAGTETIWFFGDDPAPLGDYAVYEMNKIGDVPSPVGTKKPNPWGLYDIYGNVDEYCMDSAADASANYPTAATEADAVTDPLTYNPDHIRRINRGRSYAASSTECRSAYRLIGSLGTRGSDVGFRVVFDTK